MNFIKKPYIILITCLFTFLLNIESFAQQPLNFGFEKQSVESVERPWGWNKAIWGATTFTMDSTIVKQGKYSLHSQCFEEESPCAKQIFAHNIEVFDLKGKQISISGYVKGKGLMEPISCSINYTVHDEINNTYIQKELVSEKYLGTFEWKKIVLNLEIPKSTTQLGLNIIHEGKGEAWFDDFKLKLEGKEIKEIRVAEEFQKHQMDWLVKNSIPFHSPLPFYNENELKKDDFTFFKEAIGNSKIVALGESTHGTSEFFTLKHKILQYAVVALGFRVFALEDHFIAGEEINKFIKTGEGTLKSATKNLFDTWNRKEIMNMILWMKKYNTNHPHDMISFIGVDIQEVTRPIDSLIVFLKKHDSKLYKKHVPSLNHLKEKGQYAFMESDSLVKLDWIKTSEKIFNELSAKKEKWIIEAKTKADKIKIEYGVQYANLIQQYFREVLNNGVDLYRDEAMAENISWYFEKVYPKTKMIVWAHDSHVSRGDDHDVFTNYNRGISMGSFLSKKYKSAYKSFGLLTYKGNYLAFKTYAYKEQTSVPLFTSPIGSFEEALHQVSVKKKLDNLFLNLPKSIDWLNKPLPLRFANHVSIDYGYWERLVIPSQFDGVFFIDNTNPSVKTKN